MTGYTSSFKDCSRYYERQMATMTWSGARKVTSSDARQVLAQSVNPNVHLYKSISVITIVYRFCSIIPKKTRLLILSSA